MITCPNKAISLVGVLWLAGCTSSTTLRSGALSNYAGLAPSKGILTATEVRIDVPVVMAAKRVAIMPTRLSEAAAKAGLTASQRALVANTIDRAMCGGLAERFVIVSSTAQPNLVVRATVTKIRPTDAVVAGVSRAASLGASVFLPVPVPRLPIGLGGLGVEAEAVDPIGRQHAALVWGRDADMVTSRARVSEIGDAYQLASAFGEDFAKLLTTGTDPMKPSMSLPSFGAISAEVTGQPRQSACATFGAAPGLIGMVAGAIGTPPEWGDSGAAASISAGRTP